MKTRVLHPEEVRKKIKAGKYKKRGCPYRDRKGRFCSHDDAFYQLYIPESQFKEELYLDQKEGEQP